MDIYTDLLTELGDMDGQVESDLQVNPENEDNGGNFWQNISGFAGGIFSGINNLKPIKVEVEPEYDLTKIYMFGGVALVLFLILRKK